MRRQADDRNNPLSLPIFWLLSPQRAVLRALSDESRVDRRRTSEQVGERAAAVCRPACLPTRLRARARAWVKAASGSVKLPTSKQHEKQRAEARINGAQNNNKKIIIDSSNVSTFTSLLNYKHLNENIKFYSRKKTMKITTNPRFSSAIFLTLFVLLTPANAEGQFFSSVVALERLVRLQKNSAAWIDEIAAATERRAQALRR